MRTRMMLTMTLATAALAVAALPPVQAQDGCTASDPCPWVVTVDADGFDTDDPDGAAWNGTAGDWYYLDMLNVDGDADHVLSFDALGVSWTLMPYDAVESEAFQVLEPGMYTLHDEPSGADAPVQIFANDQVDVESGAQDPDFSGSGSSTGSSADGGDNGVPGLAPALFLGTLVVAAWVARRRP